MKIYEFRGFPNPARVRIALAEKGLIDKVEFISVNVPAGEHKTPEFLARNPSGLVPVLELDDGSQISECTAITEYIDHAFPGVQLSGSTPLERARIHMMQRRAESLVMEPVNDYFHHATAGLGPALEKYQNQEWGTWRKGKAQDGMRYFDSQLAKGPYLAGESFSMADITLFAALLYAKFAKIEISSELHHLNNWRKRVSERPSIQAA